MSRPARLALVRHGESAWIAERRFQGQGDPPLSELGERQAAAVGARLAAPRGTLPLPIPETAPLAIWYSPLLRAAQTAQAVHDARGGDAPLRPLDELMELGQGEWEGLTHTEVRARWPTELAAWRADPLEHHAPGGESLREGLLRVHAVRQAILPSGPANDGAWSVVVAHGGILRLLIMDLLDIGIEHFWSFPLALASVSVLDLSADVVQLRSHNLDAHIAGLDDPTGRPRGAL